MNSVFHHAVAILFLILVPGAHAAGLNDTGQIQCYDSIGSAISCPNSATGAADDGRYGRDAAATAGVLLKTGGGSAGFDFTKIANDGTALPAGATLGNAAIDWACTRDNVTGLIWEVKTTHGLRAAVHAYTWYSTDGATNGGNAGDLGTDTCGGTLSAYSNQCNTANYVAAVNSAPGLCGATDWRLPSVRELESLADFSVPDMGMGSNPAIDTTYFPNTYSWTYWTANNFSANPVSAWDVYFGSGNVGLNYKFNHSFVRLVRGGQ